MNDISREWLVRCSKIPTKYINTNLNVDFINNKLNKDKETHIHLSNDYMRKFDWISEGKNLVIWGENCGSGKTLWASKIAQNYIMKACNAVIIEHDGNVLSEKAENWYFRVLYISFTDFILKIKDNVNNYTTECGHMINALKQADLVIWDDVLSDYREMPTSVWEALYSIVDTRAGVKSNIFTSNREPHKWQECLGAEIVSRILQKCEIVKFQNGDLRQIDL